MSINSKKIAEQLDAVSGALHSLVGTPRSGGSITEDNKLGESSEKVTPKHAAALVKDPSRKDKEMSGQETVTVSAKSVNWLKEKFPELSIRAGLCERIGGRLYTKTTIRADASAHLPRYSPGVEGGMGIDSPRACLEYREGTTNSPTTQPAPWEDPLAWLQIGLAPFHDGVVIPRATKPKKWDPKWWRFEPLYAKRQWVGLTPEEIDAIDQSMCGEREFYAPFAKALEAKLKEKNT